MPDFPDLITGTGDIILSDTETRQFEAIVAGESFAEMVSDESLFPRDSFFVDFVFSADMGEIDIAGWNFSGANLSGADMSQVKNISKAVFDRKTKFIGTKLPEGVTVEMLVR